MVMKLLMTIPLLVESNWVVKEEVMKVDCRRPGPRDHVEIGRALTDNSLPSSINRKHKSRENCHTELMISLPFVSDRIGASDDM